MKKLLLTLGTLVLVLTSAQSQAKITKLFFPLKSGEILEYVLNQEEELDETLPANSEEIFIEAQEDKLIGFDGEVFDLSIISTPEKELDEEYDFTVEIPEEEQEVVEQKVQISAK